MSKWSDNSARQKATRQFCLMLDRDPKLRENCKNDPEAARAALREAGNFEDMPNDVQVLVFEQARGDNDNLVTMVLPKEGEVPLEDEFDAREYWLCTWRPY